MDSISGWVDTTNQISPFDFSFDTSSQEQSQSRGSRNAEQSSHFDSVVADALSLSPEALEKAKVLQQGQAVIAGEGAQAHSQYQDAYAGTPYGSFTSVYTGTYNATGRINRGEQEEISATKAPTVEEIRRTPYTHSPDLANVAALYAHNVTPQENIQTRTFTPSNGAAAYEAVRLRAADGSRPTSHAQNSFDIQGVTAGTQLSAQKASAAYKNQADAATPVTDFAPPVYTGRWSVGVDLHV